MVLVVAGSDSGGGAGVQGDIKTLSALGVFATTAVTAITAQNTMGVSAVVALDDSVVSAQIQAVCSDMRPGWTKTGMLASAPNVEVVATLAAEGLLGDLVVDPVLAASTGRSLGGQAVGEAIVRHLVRHATVFTPNAQEAAVMLGGDIRSIPDMAEAARAFGALGAAWVVVKGGDLLEGPGAREAIDVIWDGREIQMLRSPRVFSNNTHGSGCAFASAIAAGLAKAQPPWDAISFAKAYVSKAIEAAAGWQLGEGKGPLDHFGWSPKDPGLQLGRAEMGSTGQSQPGR